MRNRALALGLVLLVGGGPAGAQTVAADTNARGRPIEARGDWLVGGSVGVPGYGSEPVVELFTVGIHWTQFRPGRLGADISVGTMPRVVAEGVAVVGVRAGVALPLALSPHMLLLPSAGVSAIGGAGAGGGGGLAGLNAGVAAVAFGMSRTGLRIGVTWHRFPDTRGALWLAELGFVGIR
jgi:hypothetical protein